jgi:hypothetical protein
MKIQEPQNIRRHVKRDSMGKKTTNDFPAVILSEMGIIVMPEYDNVITLKDNKYLYI